MSFTKKDLQETQEVLESHNFQEVDLLESLNFQEKLYSPMESLSLSDIEPFDLNEAQKDLDDSLGLYENQKTLLPKSENEDQLQSFSEEESINESYSLQKPTALQENVMDPADLLDIQLDLQDPLQLNSDPPSPKEDSPASLEWDSLIEPLSINQNELKDAVIIQKDIKKLPSLKQDQDPHGFEWDHIHDSTVLQDENIQQPLSQKYSLSEEESTHTNENIYGALSLQEFDSGLPEENILKVENTHGPLSLQEYGPCDYFPPINLNKGTLGLNEDDNGPKEYYGPERPDSEIYASLNTSLRPKILHKNNTLKKFNHYLVEFDDDELTVENDSALNNNEVNTEISDMPKRKNEKKRKSLSRKAKMYVTSEIFKRGENQNISKQSKLRSKNTIPKIVEISKSSENPKKTNIVIKGLEKIKNSEITAVLGNLNNYITDGAIRTALNEPIYLKTPKVIHTLDISNLASSNEQSYILRQLAIQAGLLTLNEVLDQGVLDITNRTAVQLGQLLTFSLYFHKNIRELAQSVWHSKPVTSITGVVQDIAPEVPAHLALGSSLVALTDQLEGATLDETWLGLGCLGLTYLYQIARNNQRNNQKVKVSKQKVKK